MADDDNEELSQEELFAKWYDEKRASEKAEADRTKKLKDMGLTPDVLDAIGDAVFGRFQREREERQRAEEEADEAPSRGRQSTFLGRLMTGEQAS